MLRWGQKRIEYETPAARQQSGKCKEFFADCAPCCCWCAKRILANAKVRGCAIKGLLYLEEKLIVKTVPGIAAGAAVALYVNSDPAEASFGE